MSASLLDSYQKFSTPPRNSQRKKREAKTKRQDFPAASAHQTGPAGFRAGRREMHGIVFF
jgi:hypothetical protein